MKGLRSRIRSAALLSLTLSAAACATTGPVQPAAVATDGEYLVYDAAAARFVDFGAVVDRAASADVVFFGEQHGNVTGHRLQYALLHALSQRGDATLSLEMFERDVAALVTAYAAGAAGLDSLLAHARPWPRYATDYQPQVDLARAERWPVIAANVPRALANAVSREGIGVLDTLRADMRAHAAADVQCPADAYRARFVEEMRRHPVGDTEAERAAIEQRYYEAQCVKDETMAESIARALTAGANRPVVHLTGSFHSDRGDGIPARLRRRLPDLDIVSLSVVAVPDVRRADPRRHAGRADFLLFTRAAAPTPPRN
jgi:uncharacterized iron-regulated protein